MNKLQKFCAAVILTAIFTLSAFAGDIPMPGVTNTPLQRGLATGEISFPGASAEGDILSADIPILDPLTEIMLNLLESRFSIF
ncbi:MAG TPA: hypothetical protein VM095_03930 [Pyrinomonadaceae bacterium]|nr:hypothetical protein [Pyrinomonadaceae bacterium]